MAVRKTCLASSLCLIAFFLHPGTGHEVNSNGLAKSPLQKLRRDLLSNYDKYTRPVANYNNLTSVTFGILPRYLSNLDEDKQILTLESWLQLIWDDNHLTWDPMNYSGVSHIRFAVHETWQPDIFVYSRHVNSYYGICLNVKMTEDLIAQMISRYRIPVSQIDPRMDSQIIGYPNGKQLWIPPATINSYCELNYANYPYDIQKCNITFGSWTYHGDIVDVQLYENSVSLDDFHNTNPRWEVLDVTIARNVKYYNCCIEPYVSIYTTFTIRRKQPTLPQHVLWGPSLLAILFTLAMFWLPSNSVQKVILGCTSLTVLTILLLYIGETVPSPLAAVISANEIHSLMYIVGSATLMEIIILNLGRIAGWWRPPAIVPDLLYGIVGRFLLICPSKRRFGLIDKMEAEDGEDALPRDAAEDWFVLSTALDRICFVIYLLIFIIHRNI